MARKAVGFRLKLSVVVVFRTLVQAMQFGSMKGNVSKLVGHGEASSRGSSAQLRPCLFAQPNPGVTEVSPGAECREPPHMRWRGPAECTDGDWPINGRNHARQVEALERARFCRRKSGVYGLSHGKGHGFECSSIHDAVRVSQIDDP